MEKGRVGGLGGGGILNLARRLVPLPQHKLPDALHVVHANGLEQVGIGAQGNTGLHVLRILVRGQHDERELAVVPGILENLKSTRKGAQPVGRAKKGGGRRGWPWREKEQDPTCRPLASGSTTSHRTMSMSRWLDARRVMASSPLLAITAECPHLEKEGVGTSGREEVGVCEKTEILSHTHLLAKVLDNTR